MPDHAPEPTSARDIANVAEAMVIGLPQSVTSMLLCVSLGQCEDSTGQGREVWADRDLESVVSATNYIRSDFVAPFRKAVGGMSEAMTTAHAQMDNVLRETLAKAKFITSTAEQEAIVDCVRFTQDALEPAIIKFLDALFTQVVAQEKAASELAKNVDASALSQIDVLSRQINFIAVNASVEAARVGEKGRGFATEIKALSEQSREAVDRIRMALS